MNIPELIKQRLEKSGHEQRELAVVAEVTESYISQLLTGKKSLPAPHRSDIYEKIEAFLKLPAGELTRLADAQRKENIEPNRNQKRLKRCAYVSIKQQPPRFRGSRCRGNLRTGLLFQ